MSQGESVEEKQDESNSQLWEPETPFLDILTTTREAVEDTIGEEEFTSPYQLESPFLSVFETITGEEYLTPEGEELIQLLADLHDDEFDEAVYELAGNVAELIHERFERELATFENEFEDHFTEHFSPLVQEVESLLDNMAEELDKHDLTTMTEAEVDALLDRFEPTETSLSPVFEDFFKKIWKKAKKAVKGAVKFVKKGIKKGIKIIGKLTPWAFILKKLKKIVKPLLRRVLRWAINKLPLPLRPYAKRLAKRLFGRHLKEMEYDTDDEDGLDADEEALEFDEAEETMAELSGIQHELDYHIAYLILAENETDQDIALAEYESEIESLSSDAQFILDQAREEFVENIMQLEEGEDPTPVVERFVPAILPALKLGLKIVGRGRVVNFLAKYVARLIRRYVGRRLAKPLSRALVDAGLRLFGLEITQEDETRAAGNTLAATVEETLRSVVALPEYILDDEEVLEGFVAEAFETAVAANFPPAMIKQELRESELGGTWALLPVQGRKVYKKYTQTPTLTITPTMASALRSFGGQQVTIFGRRLSDIVKNGPVKAKIHLYEAIKGTWLSKITKLERNVPGLGNIRRETWSSLHPLTKEAASILKVVVGLGRNVDERFIRSPHKIAVGQRFYFLELEKSLPVSVPRREGRSSEANIVFDFPKNQLRAAIYFSEEDAQKIATKLREKKGLGAIMRITRSTYRATLNSAMRGDPKKHIKIIFETFDQEEFIGAAARRLAPRMMRFLYRKIAVWLGKTFITEVFRRRGLEFVKATESKLNGVSVLIVFSNPPGFSAIRSLLKGKVSLSVRSIFKGSMPVPTVKIYPGFRLD